MKQVQKIVYIMATRREDQRWFYPPDFMRNDLGPAFVGYEASARLSGLARDYPEFIETRSRPGEEKYLERRIRWENIGRVWDSLPEKVRIALYHAGVNRTYVPKATL